MGADEIPLPVPVPVIRNRSTPITPRTLNADRIPRALKATVRL